MKINIGEMATVIWNWLRSDNSVDEEMRAFGAPSELSAVVYRKHEAKAKRILRERFGVTINEAYRLIERATSARWVHFNL